MAITDIEKLETLCHVRACLIKAREYVAGKLKYSKDDMALTINDGIEKTTELILEVKHDSKD